ncbi:MAG: hypothetical protein P4N60_05490 [Verrucomicrobiae bacterium]|nr:hypothetical protein [Verrucomicrobiae bacterium]
MIFTSLLHKLAQIIYAPAGSPSLWPFVFFPVLFAVLIFWKYRPPAERVLRRAHQAVVALILVLLGTILLSHLFYLAGNYLTNSYALLYANLSWISSNGQALYTSSDSVSRYSLPYGPAGYVIVGLFQHLLGPSPFSSKLPVFCSWLGGFLFLCLTLCLRHKWTTALAAITLGMAIFPHFQEFDFWPRPDFFLFFLVLFGLWMVAKDFRFTWIWLGILIGIAVDLKVHGFAYFLPVIGLLLQKRPNILAAAMGFGISLCTALMPFIVSHQISLTNYWEVLHMDAGHRFEPNFLSHIYGFLVVFSMTAFAPFIIYRVDGATVQTIIKKNAPFLLGLLAGVLLVLYPASLEGAGEHHLIPFTGLFLYLGSTFYADLKAAGHARWTLSPVGGSLIFSQWGFIYIYALIINTLLLGHLRADNRTAQIRLADLDQIMHEHANEIILNAPGSLKAVEADTYRFYPVFHGMPMGVDPTAMMDFTEGHVPEPQLDSLVEQMEAQYHRKVMWISPRNEKPFSETSYYHPFGNVFSDTFVQDFHRRFRLSGHSDWFDIYQDTKVTDPK